MAKRFLLLVVWCLVIGGFLIPQPIQAQWSAIDPRCIEVTTMGEVATEAAGEQSPPL